MKYKLFFTLIFFGYSFGCFAQLDGDYLDARKMGDYYFQIRDYDNAKKNYKTALVMNQNDTHCRDRIAEINRKEIQRKKNKEEKAKYMAARRRNVTESKPYYGTLKGQIDEDNDKFDYVGYIQNGQPEGHGIADYTPYDKDGGKEEGEWHNGKQNGKFTGSRNTGENVEMEYKDGVLNGKVVGILKEDGLEIKFELLYKNKKMYGIQKFFIPQGRIEISPSNNESEGPMTFYLNDGTIFNGYLKNGGFWGMVTVTKDGNRIVGYLNDKGFYSIIKVYTANGDIFEGYAEKDSLIGMGKLTSKNGDFVKGYFMCSMSNINNIKGNATFSFTNGNKYYGEYTNGSINGKGKMMYNDGMVYEGQWLNGSRDGYGTLTVAEKFHVKNCPKCVKYEGWFLKDRKHGLGKGKCYDINGELIYEGKFENDKPVDRYPSRIKK